MSDRYVEGLKKAVEIVRRLEGPISLVAVGDAIEAEAVAAYNRRHREAVPSHRYAEGLRRLKDRIDTRLNNVLCEMKPEYDDSITGFNEAWDIVRKAFSEALASIPPDPPPMANEDEAIAEALKEARDDSGIPFPHVLLAELAKRNLTICALSELDHLRHEVAINAENEKEYLREITRLEVDRQVLVEALEPFAKVADDFIDASPDDMRVRTFPLRLFRRARAALAIFK